MMNKQHLSKFLCYILRHNPSAYNLNLDEEGYAKVDDVLKALSKKFGGNYSRDEFIDFIESQQDLRFQLKGDKVRASYGHSKVNIKYSEDEYIQPPEILYHGTSEKAAKEILKYGLKPQGRKFVHLCEDIDKAYKVGRRHTNKPIILSIKAKEAYSEGVKFICPEKGIYLTEFLPCKFISYLNDEKSKIRERIWNLLEEKKLVYLGRCYGKIPDFIGKESAAKLMEKQDFFKKSKFVFSAPDGALSKARELTLKNKKTLIVALPRMSDFVMIDEKEKIKEASTIEGFKKYGKKLDENIKIHLFIQGAVAVDKHGNRIGKGTGFGDMEWNYFNDKGMLSKDCKVVCLVHDLQVLDENISHLMKETDKKVDYIITPTEVIKCKENGEGEN